MADEPSTDAGAQRYDLVVLGSGPGGYEAAIHASQLGLRAACVERDKLGGICLNWGCIPSKALLYDATLYREMKEGKKRGLLADNLRVDWSKVVKRSRKAAEALNKGVAGLFDKYGVEHVAGEAKLERPGRIALDDGRTLEADHVLLATGAHPVELPGAPFDGERIVDYEDAMVLDERPEHLLVIGGGAIGCEFAYLYNAFDVDVTLVEMQPNLLPLEDAEVSEGLERSFGKQGIRVRTGTIAEGFETTDHGVEAKLRPADDPDGEREPVQADRVLVAVGVAPNSAGLGLDGAGVDLDERGAVVVDAYQRTTCPGVRAIGDVTGAPALAHKASAEGIRCVEWIAGKHATRPGSARGRSPLAPVDRDNIPTCTYCEPQVASVGMTEAEAREAGHEVKVGRFPLTALGKARAVGHTEGFAKAVHDADTGELLGCHLLGHNVTDLVAEPTLARTLEATEAELLATIHPHPTMSELLHEATGQAYGESVNY